MIMVTGRDHVLPVVAFLCLEMIDCNCSPYAHAGRCNMPGLPLPVEYIFQDSSAPGLPSSIRSASVSARRSEGRNA